MDIIDALIQKGWYIKKVDTVLNALHDRYVIIPNDERKDWAANWTTIQYGILKIDLPHWYNEVFPRLPPRPLPTQGRKSSSDIVPMKM